jgi:hypothetical protein
MPSSASRTRSGPNRTDSSWYSEKKRITASVKDFIKEDRITAMKQKASARNPDEFYFGMQHNASAWSAQKTQKPNRKNLGDRRFDTVRIMKDQDLSYVQPEIEG